MSSNTILRPEITVPLASGAVTLRDLPGQDALDFLQRLSAMANQLIKDGVRPDGSVDIASVLPQLEALVKSSGDLAMFLITKSAGKDADWLAQFGALEYLALLDAALEVNLSDGLLELGKKVAARLGRVWAANKRQTSDTPASATS